MKSLYKIFALAAVIGGTSLDAFALKVNPDFSEVVIAHSQYDSSSGVYTLTSDALDGQDFMVGDASYDKDMKIDMNGFDIRYFNSPDGLPDMGSNCTLELFNGKGQSDLSNFENDFKIIEGKEWIVGEGVVFYPFGVYRSELLGTLRVKSGGYLAAPSGHSWQMKAEAEIWTGRCLVSGEIVLEEGAKIGQNMVALVKEQGWVPSGCQVGAPDADGYCQIEKPNPEILLVSAAQRYPWNNVVDYTYALSNCNASKSYKLAVGLTVGGVTKVSTNELTTVADGNYTGTIDAATLFPNTFDKAGKIKLQLIEVQ